MTSGFHAAINEMMAELRDQYEGMIRLQDSASKVSGTANSPRQQVTATVDSRGALTGIRFNGNSYRTMAPEELASMIVETVRAAQQNARRALREYVGDLGLPGADLDALADGTMDWRSAYSDTFTLPQPLLDLLGAAPTDLVGRGEQPPAEGAGP